MFKRIWFDVDGGGNGGGAPTGAPSANPNGGGGNAGNNPPKTFTQEEVNQLLGDRAKRADEVVTKTLLDGLGLKTLDELKAVVKKAGDLEAAQLTELDKAKKAAEKAEAERLKLETETSAQIARANERLLRAAVLSEAMKAEYNFRPDALNDVWLFVDRASIKPQADNADEFEGIAAALKKVAEAKPYLVGTAQPARSIDNDAQRGRGAQPAGQPLTREQLIERKRADYQSL